jgi:hypothetical protein
MIEELDDELLVSGTNIRKFNVPQNGLSCSSCGDEKHEPRGKHESEK